MIDGLADPESFERDKTHGSRRHSIGIVLRYRPTPPIPRRTFMRNQEQRKAYLPKPTTDMSLKPLLFGGPRMPGAVVVRRERGPGGHSIGK